MFTRSAAREFQLKVSMPTTNHVPTDRLAMSIGSMFVCDTLQQLECVQWI